MDVAGKRAVIFGGTSGIGLAAAKQLAALGAVSPRSAAIRIGPGTYLMELHERNVMF